MSKLGQKQKQKSSETKKGNSNQYKKEPIRTELLPDWFEENPYSQILKVKQDINLMNI